MWSTDFRLFGFHSHYQYLLILFASLYHLYCNRHPQNYLEMKTSRRKFSRIRCIQQDNAGLMEWSVTGFQVWDWWCVYFSYSAAGTPGNGKNFLQLNTLAPSLCFLTPERHLVPDCSEWWMRMHEWWLSYLSCLKKGIKFMLQGFSVFSWW